MTVTHICIGPLPTLQSNCKLVVTDVQSFILFYTILKNEGM